MNVGIKIGPIVTSALSDYVRLRELQESERKQHWLVLLDALSAEHPGFSLEKLAETGRALVHAALGERENEPAADAELCADCGRGRRDHPDFVGVSLGPAMAHPFVPR